jgi:hypothetical protein
MIFVQHSQSGGAFLVNVAQTIMEGKKRYINKVVLILCEAF